MAPVRICPGVGDKKCGSFRASVDKDPHPVCKKCRGQECTRDLTCDVCVSWSEEQWKKFDQRKRYKSKSRAGSVVSVATSSASSAAPRAPADPFGGLTTDEF